MEEHGETPCLTSVCPSVQSSVGHDTDQSFRYSVDVVVYIIQKFGIGPGEKESPPWIPQTLSPCATQCPEDVRNRMASGAIQSLGDVLSTTVLGFKGRGPMG